MLPAKMNHRITVPNRLQPSVEQREALIIFMESQPAVAKRQITKLGQMGSEKLKKIYIELSDQLNEYGPAVKIPTDWQAYWTSMRLGAKNAMNQYLYVRRGTGNNNIIPPSDQDLQIANIFGKYGLVCGILPEIGICDYKNDQFNNMEGEQIFDQLMGKEEIFNGLNLVEDMQNRTALDATLQLLEQLCNNLISSFKVKQVLINIVLHHMQNNSLLARGDLSEAEIRLQWAPIFDILKAAEPTLDLDFWIKWWEQLCDSVLEKRNRILNKESRAKWTELDQRVFDVYTRGLNMTSPSVRPATRESRTTPATSKKTVTVSDSSVD